MQYKTSFESLPPEAWVSLTGENIDTGGLEQTWRASGILARAVDICADALSAIPFDIYSGETIIDSSEDYRNAAGVLPRPERLLYLTEASMKVFGAAYFYRVPSVVRGRVAEIRWLSPANIILKYDEAGGVRYKLKDSRQTVLRSELVTPLWEADPYVELGAPLASAAQRAAVAADVLVNVDKFAAMFFKRGAIKGTIFGVDTVDPVEREKFGAWVDRLFRGIRDAWRTAVFNMRGVQPVVIGEGLESLSNPNLTTEKAQAVLMTMGIPASLMMANAANYATAQQDKRNFYADTIIPDAMQIESALNAALAPLGYRFRFAFDRLPVMAQTNDERAKAAETIAKILQFGRAGLAALDVAGYPLSDEQRAEIERAISEKSEPERAQNSPPEPQNEPETSESGAMVGDVAKWHSKALKALRKTGSAVCEFESDEISEAAKSAIKSALVLIRDERALRRMFEETAKAASVANKLDALLKGGGNV